MKKYLYTLLLCLSYSSSLFATQDQTRGLLKKTQLKDSISHAIIQKQDSMIRVNEQMEALSKNKAPEKSIDSLTDKKNVMLAQIHDLEKINIPAEDQEVQSTLLSIATLVFGIILVTLVFVFRNKTNSYDAYFTYKLIGIVFIGTVSVFLIPAGFDNAQITPVVGLLGTLAGYLAGTSHQNSTTPPAPIGQKEAAAKESTVNE